MKRMYKFLAILLTMALILPGIAGVVFAAPSESAVKRLGGTNRVKTSIAVSQEAYKSAGSVILAGTGGEIDALTGTLLASDKDAPLLLVDTANIKEVNAEIKRLGATKAYIIGGPLAVSEDLEAAIDVDTERIAGGNRYSTAAAVAKKFSGPINGAFIVNGETALIDALLIGPVAKSLGMPILLTKKDEVPEDTLDAIEKLEIKDITIIGGPLAVSEKVKTDLGADRVSGINRYETALAVAREYLANSKGAVIANGEGFVDADGVKSYADALVGGYLAALKGAPVLLVDPKEVPATTKTYIEANVDGAYVLGGELVVGDDLFEDIKEAVETVEGLEVVSVSAIKAKGIEVTFNDEIDTTKASIVVKKGNVTVNVDSIEFADDKKSAVINTTTKLTKGEYTVTVSGLTEEALVASFEAENEKVAEINVLSETAPLNPQAKTISGEAYAANETAFVNYEVLNQYGEKMSNQTITWTQSTGGKVEDNSRGQLIIGNTATAGTKFIPGNKVFLTGVHGNTATVVNAEVTIGLESKVAEVEFKGVYNTAKNKLEDLPAGFTANKYVLLFEAKDQYGNKMDTTGSDLTLLSDNPLFIAQPVTPLDTDVTIDDVDYKALKLAPGSQAAKGGTATIQIVSNNTGKVTKYTISADALSAVTEFSISAPEKLVAGGEKVEIPFTAVDQYGNAVTKHSELNGKVTLSAGLAFEKQQDGSAKLFYTTPANATQNDRIDTLTTLIPTNGDYSNIQLTVKPNATPEAIIGLNEDVSTSIAAGNDVKFKGEDLLVQDQYGRTLEKDQVNAWLDGAGDTAIVIESDNGAGAITVTSTNTNGGNADGFSFVEASGETFTVAATGAAGANTEKLVFSLSTGATPPTAASVVSASSKSVTFTRVAQSEYASYEVADLGVMYNNATDDTATNAKYKVVPKVYGVTESGKKVLLPASKYSITTNGKLDVSTPGEIADLATAGYDAPDFKDANGNAKDITVKVTIMVEDGNGAAAATIEKDLVVSNATPVAETVTLTNKVVNGAAFVDKTALNNDEPGGGATLTNAALNAFVKEIKDQYGVVITPTADITISKVEKVDGSTLTVADNGKDDVKITGATEGDKFTATFKYAGGKTVSVNFVVSDN